MDIDIVFLRMVRGIATKTIAPSVNPLTKAAPYIPIIENRVRRSRIGTLNLLPIKERHNHGKTNTKTNQAKIRPNPRANGPDLQIVGCNGRQLG
jgi:hypothetical protein